jgi:myo-inositol-1(or 4)-monophosphatase
LIEEAGGTLTDFAGAPWTIDQNYFIASNGVAHGALVDLVKVVH